MRKQMQRLQRVGWDYLCIHVLFFEYEWAYFIWIHIENSFQQSRLKERENVSKTTGSQDFSGWHATLSHTFIMTSKTCQAKWPDCRDWYRQMLSSFFLILFFVLRRLASKTQHRENDHDICTTTSPTRPMGCGISNRHRHNKRNTGTDGLVHHIKHDNRQLRWHESKTVSQSKSEVWRLLIIPFPSWLLRE